MLNLDRRALLKRVLHSLWQQDFHERERPGGFRAPQRGAW
jgi:hypothetical protein